jgi:hypothetical protein
VTRIHTVVNPNFGKTNPCVSCWFTSLLPCYIYPCLLLSHWWSYLVVSVCEVQALYIHQGTDP